jgi:hypothetical protein
VAEEVMIALSRRFMSLHRSEQRLVVEAVALLAGAWIGLRLLRFLTLRRILGRYAALPPATMGRLTHSRVVSSVRWAITSVSAHVPSATCLVQALAADAMLRRRGVASELRLGVRLRLTGGIPIEAHAWVECDGGVLIGAAEHQSEFTVLTP